MGVNHLFLSFSLMDFSVCRRASTHGASVLALPRTLQLGW